MDGNTTYDPPRLGRKGGCGVAVLGFVFCLCLLLGTCVSRIVVARVKSPDGRLVASVVETNGGATTSYGYEVDIARNWPLRWTHAVAGLHGATRSDCAYGVNVSWLANDKLLISYGAAKSTDVDRAVHLLDRTVRVITRAGVNDPTARCGGMEDDYNGSVGNAR